MSDYPQGRVYNRKPINPRAAAEGQRNREAVVEAVAAFWDEHDKAPTRPWLADKVGLSLKSTKAHVAHLLTEGRLVEDGPGTLRVP